MNNIVRERGKYDEQAVRALSFRSFFFLN